LAGVQVSVRVAAKMLRHRLAQGVDLGVERLDEPDLAGDDGGEGLLNRGRLSQRGRLKDGLDLHRLGGDIPAVGLAQRRADPAGRQSCRTVWVGRGSE
jgi:hypothetical protein